MKINEHNCIRKISLKRGYHNEILSPKLPGNQGQKEKHGDNMYMNIVR